MTLFGRSVRRVEDADLLTGAARFVDDLDVSATAHHLVVLRSPLAHAAVRIGASPGGPTVITPGDVAHLRWDQLLPGPPPITPLGDGVARYVGQPVAAAVAPTVESALGALDALDVDFEPRPAAIGVARAVAADAPLVYDDMDSNVVWRDESGHDPGLFSDAEVVLHRTFVNHRVAPAMMECRAITAVPEGNGVTVYVGHQNAHKLHRELAAVLDLDSADVRIVVPEVGGGFGAKSPLYPEYVLAAHAALRHGHPVKFIETRTENLLVTTHGRGQTQRIEIGATRDGRITALRAEIDVDFGATADLQRWCAALTRHMLSGAYRIPRIEWTVRGVLTHTAPLGAFRGAGRPEATYLIERAIDEVAAELAMDPAAVRCTNFIAPEDFPYETATGATYDSGAYATALDAALDLGRYEQWRQRQKERRAAGEGKLIGIGIASYVEMAAGGEEFAAVAVGEDGSVTVRTGTSPHGQGHHTAWAQLAAERLGVSIGAVTVVHGDTAVVPRGGGTSGSRSVAIGGSAVARAADRVAARLRRLAADRLEASPDDIVLTGGRAIVAGTDVGVPITDVVAASGGTVTEDEVFRAGGQNFPFGTHLCVVEVAADTGEVDIIDHVAIDDCGRVLNPLLVEGQIHGGIMQGISYALTEEARFDDHGQPLTTGLHTYRIPTVAQVVPLTSRRTETPSPVNPMGLKGVGESGITGATPAVANAVFDALRPLGVGEDSLTMPFTPDGVWAAVAEVAR